MTSVPGTDLRQAVTAAVQMVNASPGRASIRLMFTSPQFEEVDIVAQRALLQGNHFSFSAGIQTVDGQLDELAGIRSELISH